MTKLSAAWLVEARSQLQGSPLLRMGLLAIAFIVWIYALLLASDLLTVRERDLAATADDLARLQPRAGDGVWLGRADEAQRQLKALEAMLWTESDIGVAEAAFQDWVRTTAGRAGLVVRELTLSKAAAAAAPSGATSAPAAYPAGPQAIKIRLAADFNTDALVGFLSEVARSERAVVVDRLLLRTAATPATCEIDLRILARPRTQNGAAK